MASAGDSQGDNAPGGTGSEPGVHANQPKLYYSIKAAIESATPAEAATWSKRMADNGIKGFSYQTAVQIYIIFRDLNDSTVAKATYTSEGTEDIDITYTYTDDSERVVLCQVKHERKGLNLLPGGTLLSEFKKAFNKEALSLKAGFGKRSDDYWMLWTTQRLASMRNMTQEQAAATRCAFHWLTTQPSDRGDMDEWKAEEFFTADVARTKEKLETSTDAKGRAAAQKRHDEAGAFVNWLGADGTAEILATKVFVNLHTPPPSSKKNHTKYIIDQAVEQVYTFACNYSNTFRQNAQKEPEQAKGLALALYQELFTKIMTGFDASRGASIVEKLQQRTVDLCMVKGRIQKSIDSDKFKWEKVADRVHELRSQMEQLDNPGLYEWYKMSIQALAMLSSDPRRFTVQAAQELEGQLSPIFGSAYGIATRRKKKHGKKQPNKPPVSRKRPRSQ